MKRLGFIPWVLVAFLLIQRVPQIWQSYSLEGGPAALEHALTAVDGAVLHPTPPYAMIFWATWCGPCTFELSRVNKMIEAGELKPEKVLAISIDDEAEKARSTWRERGYRFPVVWDENHRLADRFKVEVTPTVIVVSEGEKVSWASSGLSPLLSFRLRQLGE